MSRGPEAVRSRESLPGVNTKLGTASSIYNALAFRWSSWLFYLTNNPEPNVGTGHCGKEIASLGGAPRHAAESEATAANHLSLACAPQYLAGFPAGRPLRVDALAELVVIVVIPI